MTIIKEQYIGGERYIEGFCVALDDKPTEDIAMGSKLFCIDENKTYYYMDENSGWVEPGPITVEA